MLTGNIRAERSRLQIHLRCPTAADRIVSLSLSIPVSIRVDPFLGIQRMGFTVIPLINLLA